MFLVALLAIVPATVGAAIVTDAWSAKIGSAGTNGTATIQVYMTGKGSFALKVAKLARSSSLAVTLHKGTCGSVGAVLLALAAIKTSSTGGASRTTSLTAGQVAAVTKAIAATGKIAIRIGTGKTAKCDAFTAAAVQPYVAATITVGPHPYAVTLAPSGVWVSNYLDNTLSRIDATSNRVLQTLPLTLAGNAGPAALAYGGGSLWVTAQGFDNTGKPAPGSVLRINPSNGQVEATIALGRRPLDLAVTTGAVWVTAYEDGALARIDPAVNAVVAMVPVCTNPIGVTVAFGAVWTSCADGSVARLDPATNAVVTTFRTQNSGGFIAATDAAIWVTNAGHQGSADGSVTRIDPTTNAVTANIPVGSSPQRIAYGGGSLWIGLWDTPTVVRVNATTDAVMARITVAGPVSSLAATTQSVWVCHIPADVLSEAPGTVTRINYRGLASGPLQTPPAKPAPSASAPTASPVAPTASPAGGFLYSGTYFRMALPAGWTLEPPTGGGATDTVVFDGTGDQRILAQSQASNSTLEALTALAAAQVDSNFGALPEQTAAITLGGARGNLLYFHATTQGVGVFILEAVSVHNGRAYMIIFLDDAGYEAADLLLFPVLASFAFTGMG